MSHDQVLPYRLHSSTYRGRLVALDEVLQTILTRHQYPPLVAQLLAETILVAVTLASALKYDGKFVLQARGDGPVSFLVVDVTSAGAVRAYASYDAAAIARADQAATLGLMGKGYLSFTVDQSLALGEAAENYQGIVELRGSRMVDAARHYFLQSEQIRTALQLEAAQDAAGRWFGRCLMLQQMPETTHAANENEAQGRWQHLLVLMATATLAELLDPALPADQLLYRFFHDEALVLDAPKHIFFECRCHTRVPETLRAFGSTQLEEMAEADGILKMTCQFCNQEFRFDGAARAALFSPSLLDVSRDN